MNFQLLYLVATLAPTVFADVKFLTPAAGQLYAGGAALSISWTDSGDAPPLSELVTYGISLCAGGNAPGSFDCTLAQLVGSSTFAATGNKASAVVPASAGESVNLGYFLQIVSATATGEQITNYSPRFSLNTMTGTLKPAIRQGIKSIGTSTAGPGTTAEQLPGADAPAAAAPAAGAFDVPYNMQEGLTRYAPMQAVPGTRITAQNASPQWPTSSVVMAVTYLARPTIQTTITQSQTFVVASNANTASPAPMPMDDMQKFLNRWKD